MRDSNHLRVYLASQEIVFVHADMWGGVSQTVSQAVSHLEGCCVVHSLLKNLDTSRHIQSGLQGKMENGLRGAFQFGWCNNLKALWLRKAYWLQKQFKNMAVAWIKPLWSLGTRKAKEGTQLSKEAFRLGELFCGPGGLACGAYVEWRTRIHNEIF